MPVSPSPSDHRFPHHLHLRRTADFDRVFKEGKRAGSRCLLAFALPNGEGHPRVGFAVTKKLGSAPVRNRVRRVMREALRLNRHLLTASIDVVLLPKRDWADYRLKELEPSMQSLLRKLDATFPREVSDH